MHGRHAHDTDQQRIGNDAKRHADRSIDKLSAKTDQNEGKDGRKIKTKNMHHNPSL
jgi:hypothetical protein